MFGTKRAVLLCICVYASALFFAAISHRAGFIDGAFLYFRILQHGALSVDAPTHRYFDCVLQFPAVLIIWLLHGAGLRVATGILDFSYLFHPLLSLGITYGLLYQRKRTDLIVFPLLSLATATESTLAFATGTVPETLSLFWPLFFVVLLRRNRSRADLAAMIALSIALALTHETAIMCFSVIAAVALWRLRKQRRYFDVATAVVSLAGIAVLIYFIAYQASDAHSFGFFADSLKKNVEPFRIYCFIIIAFFTGLMALGTARRNNRTGPRVLIGAALASSTWFLGFVFLMHPEQIQIWDTYLARTTASTLAAIIALGAFFVVEKASRNWQQGPLGKAALTTVCCALLIASLYDMQLTRKWRRGTDGLRALLNRHERCIFLSQKEWKASYARYGIADWPTQYLSILLHEGPHIHTLVFVEHSPWMPPASTSPCSELDRGVLGNAFSPGINLNEPSSYDFSEIILKRTLFPPKSLDAKVH